MTETITIERIYRTTIDDLWDLWTTKEGIESWWGPEGFKVKVHELALRVVGGIHYTMIAVAPEQIKFMKEAGMPLEHEARHTYTEIVPKRRLAQNHVIDFIPGVKPYQVSSVVEFNVNGPDVRMLLTLEAMHDEEWTERCRMGWESQLGKLPNAIKEANSKSQRPS